MSVNVVGENHELHQVAGGVSPEAVAAIQHLAAQAAEYAKLADESAQEAQRLAGEAAENALVAKNLSDSKGKPEGIASLGTDGMVPLAQLPESVKNPNWQEMQAAVFGNRTLYVQGTHLDSMIEPGFYALSSSAHAQTSLGFPLNSVGGVLKIFRFANMVIQTYYAFTGTSDFVKVFYRHYYKAMDGSVEFWSSWDEAITSDNIFSQPTALYNPSISGYQPGFEAYDKDTVWSGNFGINGKIIYHKTGVLTLNNPNVNFNGNILTSVGGTININVKGRTAFTIMNLYDTTINNEGEQYTAMLHLNVPYGSYNVKINNCFICGLVPEGYKLTNCRLLYPVVSAPSVAIGEGCTGSYISSGVINNI